MQAHPSDVLRMVLVRYVAFHGCSTSGVEQNFSQLQRQVTPARDHMNADVYFAEAKVLIDSAEHDMKDICREAQSCWRELYGAPRKSCQCRVDAGVPRKRQADSLATWTSKRRQHIAENAIVVSRDTAA